MGTNVYSHVNWFLEFKKAADRVDFEEFKEASSHRIMFVMSYVLASVYFIKTSLSVQENYPSALSTIFLIVAVVANLFFGTAMVLYKFRDLFCGDRDIPAAVKSWFKFCESVWMVGLTACCSLELILIGYNGKCFDVHVSGCNYSGIDGKMPQDAVFAAIVLPIFMAMAVKGATWLSVMASFAIVLFSILFTVIHFDMQLWWSPFIFFTLAALLVLYDHQRQLIAMYLLTLSKDDLLQELEKHGEEINAKELRSMIANVAHDLKTVRLTHDVCVL